MGDLQGRSSSKLKFKKALPYILLAAGLIAATESLWWYAKEGLLPAVPWPRGWGFAVFGGWLGWWLYSTLRQRRKTGKNKGPTEKGPVRTG